MPAYHLTVLRAGRTYDRPAEMLGSAPMRRLVDTLRTQFDRIVDGFRARDRRRSRRGCGARRRPGARRARGFHDETGDRARNPDARRDQAARTGVQRESGAPAERSMPRAPDGARIGSHRAAAMDPGHAHATVQKSVSARGLTAFGFEILLIAGSLLLAARLFGASRRSARFCWRIVLPTGLFLVCLYYNDFYDLTIVRSAREVVIRLFQAGGVGVDPPGRSSTSCCRRSPSSSGAFFPSLVLLPRHDSGVAVRVQRRHPRAAAGREHPDRRHRPGGRRRRAADLPAARLRLSHRRIRRRRCAGADLPPGYPRGPRPAEPRSASSSTRYGVDRIVVAVSDRRGGTADQGADARQAVGGAGRGSRRPRTSG